MSKEVENNYLILKGWSLFEVGKFKEILSRCTANNKANGNVHDDSIFAVVWEIIGVEKKGIEETKAKNKLDLWET